MEVVSCLWKPFRNNSLQFHDCLHSSLDSDFSLHFLTLPPPRGRRTRDRCTGKKRKIRRNSCVCFWVSAWKPKKVDTNAAGWG